MQETTQTNPFAGLNPMGGFNPFAEQNHNPEEPMWEALIGKIIDGEVIPIIGPDFLSDNLNIHAALIDGLASWFRVMPTPHTFSELVYDPQYLSANQGDRDSVYTWINNLCGPNAPEQKPSDLLVSLLQSKLFPFVITTSFTPIVEQTMRKVWGKDLKTLVFNNNPNENDDINNESDLLKPTVYYMFGRAGDSRAHRYVVTDQDMLEFCSSWLSGEDRRRPVRLIRALRNKFLLMLGTDYSDWLFRFIWYSVRKESGNKDAKNDMIVNTELEDSFRRFMERNKTYLKNNPQEVVTQIRERMEAKYAAQPSLRDKLTNRVVTKFSYPEESADVFLSYSRRDSAFVELLYHTLTQKGLNVWYDRNNLTDGGRFMSEIKQAVKTARFFVPILSSNVIAEKNADHVYRREWDFACEVRMGRTYIIPVAEKDFDFYHAQVREEIKTHNAIEFSDLSDVELVAQKLLVIIQSVKI